MKAINVYPRLFGGPLRAGDLLGSCNFLEHIRLNVNDPHLQLYIPNESVFQSEHCILMRNWLERNTDYVTTRPIEIIEMGVTPGTDPTYTNMYNIWNIRNTLHQNVFTIEDRIKIHNKRKAIPKIVICPLMDAPYNTYRNWSLELLQKIVNDFSLQYREPKQRIICSKEVIHGLNINEFVYSHDFEINLEHILECETFVGGETWSSLFASALDPAPRYMNFYFSKDYYGTTYPFHNKGVMNYY